MQVVEVVDNAAQRDEKFFELMTKVKSEGSQAMVFFESKRECDNFASAFRHRGFEAVAIHSDVEQSQRTHYLKMFKEGKIKFLLGTDVMQRGLDVKGVGYVVNYSEPRNAEDYVHRIGRTGRAGNKGTAVTFIDRSEGSRIAPELIKMMREVGQTPSSDLEQLARQPKRSAESFGRRGGGGAPRRRF